MLNDPVIVFGVGLDADQSNTVWTRNVSSAGQILYWASRDRRIFGQLSGPVSVDSLKSQMAEVGGIILAITPHGPAVDIQVWCNEVGQVTLPRFMMQLSVKGPWERLPLKSGEVFSLSSNDRLLVPASDREMDRVEAFQRGLDGLPTDRRAAVLEALVDPLLEVRVARVEHQLDVLTSQQVSAAVSTSQPTAPPNRFPWIQHGLVALVTVMIILAVLVARQNTTETPAVVPQRFDSIITEMEAAEGRILARLDKLQTKVEALTKKAVGARGEAKAGKLADDKPKQ